MTKTEQRKKVLRKVLETKGIENILSEELINTIKYLLEIDSEYREMMTLKDPILIGDCCVSTEVVLGKWKCPHCGTEYELDDRCDYCPSCGTGIDWSVLEDYD